MALIVIGFILVHALGILYAIRTLRAQDSNSFADKVRRSRS